jgi:uncharacterized protein (TIGR02099 family)
MLSHSRLRSDGPHRRPLKWALGTVAAIIILAAVLVGLFRVVANVLPRYHNEIEQRVAARLGVPVSLGRISLAWRGWGPALMAHDVTVRAAADGQVVISARALRLDFTPWALFHGTNARPSGFRLVQPQVVLKQLPDGRFTVPGLKFKPGAGSSPFQSMLGDAISVRDGRVRIELADAHKTVWTMDRMQLDVGSGLSHRLRFSALLPAALGGGTLQVQGEVGTPDVAVKHWYWRVRFGLDRLRLGSLIRFLPQPVPRIAGEVAIRGRLVGTGSRLATATGQIRVKDLAAGDSRIVRLISDFRFASGAQQVLTLTRAQVRFAQRLWQPGTVRFAHDKSGRIHFDMQNVQLNVVPLLVGFLPGSRVALGARLVAMHPTGRVRNLRFALTPGKPNFDLMGTLHDVSLAHVKNTLGADHVSAKVDIRNGVGVVHLDAPGLTLLMPHLFGHPVRLDSVRGEVLVALTDSGLRIGLQRFRLAGPALSGALLGVIDVPRKGPVFVRLAARAKGTDVLAARMLYLPHGLLTKPLDKWLMKSFGGGRITGAALYFDGPVNTFPYAHGDGYFGVDFGYTDVTLSPGRGWAPLKDLSGRVRFENAGMRATITRGDISGAHVVTVAVAIPNFFNNLHLLVKADIAGDANNFLAFLHSSPIAGQLGGAFGRVHAKGPTRTQLALDLPLMHPNRFMLLGTLFMRGVEVKYAGLPFALKDLKGSDRYDAKGPLNGRFTAQLDGAPVVLRVGRSDTNKTVRATLAGTLSATTLNNFLPPILSKHFSGRLPLRLVLNIPMNKRGSALTLDADSDLRGFAIRLPAPLGKPATAAIPLAVRVVIHGARLTVAARYGQVLTGCADIDANTQVPAVRGLHLMLGVASCKQPVTGLAFSGNQSRLALDPWIRLLTKSDFSVSGAGNENRLDGLRLDLHFGELKVFGQTLRNQTVTGALGRKRMLLSLDGDDLEGKAQIPRRPDNANPIVVEIAHARFLLSKTPVMVPTNAGVPSVATIARPAVITAAAASRAKSEAANNGLHLQDFPPFVLHADRVNLGTANFNDVLVRVRRLPSGIEFNPLRVGGGTLDFDGALVWVKPAGQTGHGQGALKFLSNVHHLGDLLEGIGIGPVITGHGAVSASLAWSESQAAGARLVNQLQGRVSVDLRDGEISQVRPGAGRLLSVLNLANIPRYLTFNFHNLVGKGFPFSRIHGDYAIDKGIASTKGLIIDSSVAWIKLTGTMNMDHQTLNQRAQIEPNYTGSLPIIGALVGGLGIGAAIFAMTKIFGHAIAQASRLDYSITGPFGNPTVKPVKGTHSPLPATRARPATAGGATP